MISEKYKSVRSDKYQYLLQEVSVDLNDLSNTIDLKCQLHAARYSPRFAELNDQAFQRIMDLCKEHLTEKQYVVISLFLKGHTQQEIAKILNIHQSSITKSLNGNVDYAGKLKHKRYGGSSKKMRKFFLEDQILKDIMKDMRDCDDLLWELKHPTGVVHYNSEYNATTNIYYMVSTLFHDDDEFYRWIYNINDPSVKSE